MTKLESAFKSLQARNPYWSSYTCLANAIIGKNHSKSDIGQALKKLVDKDDYDKRDRDRLLEHLCSLRKQRNEKIDSESPIKMGTEKYELLRLEV
ncbi:MAG: hypothetical protein P4L27_05380 [Ignavibacteriaceae bacterium]|nr:hypothetical protein [Ignavibacteriaceae bacterium]